MNSVMKSVKKIILTGLVLFLSVGLAGCDSKKTSKDNQSSNSGGNYTHFQDFGGKRKSKKMKKMTPEETKTLTVDMKIDKIPDAKTIESMGLAYEVVYQNKTTYEDGKVEEGLDSDIGEFASEVTESYTSDVAINGVREKSEGSYQYVHIMPIEDLRYDKDEKRWLKGVTKITGEGYLIDVEYKENIEILKGIVDFSEF